MTPMLLLILLLLLRYPLLSSLGYLDVTLSPFNVTNDDIHDVTASLQAPLTYAQSQFLVPTSLSARTASPPPCRSTSTTHGP